MAIPAETANAAGTEGTDSPAGPDGTADLDARLQAYVTSGEPPARVRARHPVNAPMIALWADALGDPDPIYVDEEAAVAAGRPGIVAPPTMVQAWTMPPLPDLARTLATVPGYAYYRDFAGAADDREDREPREPGPVAAAHRLLSDAGFTARAATRCRQTYHREARPGDHLTCASSLASVSARKETALGPGHFLTTRMVFTDQEEREVTTMEWTVLCFRAAAPASAEGVAADAAPGERAPGGELRRRRCAAPAAPPVAGDRLPGAVIPLSETFVVATAFATQDYYAAHHDTDWTRTGLGRPGIFLNILTTTGLVGGVVTDWAGPAARLRETDLRLLAPAHAGDTLTLDGRVDEVDGRTARVTVTGRTSLGLHVAGTVVAELADA